MGALTRATSLLLLVSCNEKTDATTSAPVPSAIGLDCTARADAKLQAEIAAGTVPRGGTISDAEAVVASLRPRFELCRQSGLSGCVVLRTFVAPSGTVERSVVFVREGLPDGVVQCLSDAVQSAKFAPPGGNGSALQIPVTFAR